MVNGSAFNRYPWQVLPQVVGAVIALGGQASQKVDGLGAGAGALSRSNQVVSGRCRPGKRWPEMIDELLSRHRGLRRYRVGNSLGGTNRRYLLQLECAFRPSAMSGAMTLSSR